MDALIVDHSQDSPNVSPSFDNEEDKLLIENPLDSSSVFFKNTENEFVRFSSTPLFNSSDHKDAEELIDFSNHGIRDPFYSILDHNHEYIAVDLEKPPLYDDLLDHEVETPKTTKAL